MRLMRTSDSQCWESLRNLLRSESFAVELTHVAFSAEQADDSEFAVVVDDGREVISLAWQPSSGAILEWTRITDLWRDTPYRTGIAAAFELRGGA